MKQNLTSPNVAKSIQIWGFSLKYLILIACLQFTLSCQLPTIYDPHWNDSDWIPMPDPIVVDTVPVVDTCTGYIEYTDPQFSTLYIKFDTPQDSVLWQGGGISSYDLGEVVQHITSLPFQFGTSPIGAWVIIKGTNNHSQFQTKVFTTTPGGKWYFGTGRQFLILPGATSSEFIENINLYPSFDFVSFYGTYYDSTTNAAVMHEILKDCHGGRWYADLYFIQNEIPFITIDSFYQADWERVRIH